MDPDVLQSTLDDLAYLVIPPSHLTFENDVELGCGGYGEVYLALLTRSTDTPPLRVAVKQLRIVQAKEVRRRIAIRLVRELKVWAASKHPNILELVGFYLADNHGCAQFVSAYMAHGNVKDYIKVHQPTVAVRLNFVQGITSGINYLHGYDPPICHGDLKPSNVLVTDNIEAVLCDFGLATFIEASGVSSGLTTSKSVKGSTRYMSPELLQDSGAKHTLESDVWAWACTAFEVLTNYQPYHTAMGDVSVMKALVLGKCPGSVEMISDVAPDNDPACHRVLDPLKCIIAECWASDPGKRPSSSEIMSRVFFQCDTKPSDAPSALSEPPSYELTRPVVLAFKKEDDLEEDELEEDELEEDELEEDQNNGRLDLPTEHGLSDSYFTPSPGLPYPQIGADGERGSETFYPFEYVGDELFTVLPLQYPRNVEDRQETMAQPSHFTSDIISFDTFDLPQSVYFGLESSDPPPPPPPTPLGLPFGSLDVRDSLPPSVVKRSEGFICQVPACGRVCKSIGGLKRHSRTHMAKSYSCEECGKKFHHARDLSRHGQLHQKPEA